MENEQIGKIKLDYTHYCGEDLYSDGEIEQEILEAAKNNAEVEYPRIIEEKGSWPFLYHLSPIRENIIEWLPMTKKTKVLEVGSGCGAITGALARKAGSVDCVDLSRQRSLVNAYRHEYCDNVTIHVGNFQDIEPDLESDYDVICLIGVFEYGRAYISGDNPYETFLNILKKHLAPEGQIVIAIENKFGLKYFAGCREDHAGTLFEGIEDYPGAGVARTFTQRGLLEIAQKCDFGSEECHMYYPYPDYKFMHTLFSPERLPEKGELKDNIRNFDRDRLLLFDEKLAFENILSEKEFPLFSNSYIMILGKKPNVIYARYSNDRDFSKCIATEIFDDNTVEKRPLNADASEHVLNMAENYKLLRKKYEGSRLEICPCEITEDGKAVKFPVVRGRRLEELFDEKVLRADTEGFTELFMEYVDRIGFNENMSVSDMDLIFSNIIVDGDRWTVIDYEWVVKEKKYAKELAFRSLYCYLMEDERRNFIDGGELLSAIGIDEQTASYYRNDEKAFQKAVTGNHKSLNEIRTLIGNRVIKPEDMGRGTARVGKMQVYVDRGEGFSEDTSLFPRMQDGIYSVKIDGGVKRLRIDPASEKCLVAVGKISWNGEELTVEGKGDSCNGSRIGEGLYAFGTDDPGFTLSLAGAEDRKENILEIDMEITPLSENMGRRIPKEKTAGGLGRLFKRK